MKKLLTLLLIGAALTSVRAQLQYSVGNLLRYGNGTQIVSGLEQRKEYIENQTNVRFYLNEFTVGFQYMYDDPPEFGPRYQGLRKRYVEYAREGLELRAGDYYTLYGKGLSMNLFENRGLNYDTGLDGLRGIYHDDYFNAILAVGTLKYNDLLDPTYIETYSVRSGNLEVMPIERIRLGASLLGVSGATPERIESSDIRADILGLNGAVQLFGFDVYAEYSRKHSYGLTIGPLGAVPFDRTGEGYYGSLSYTSDLGFGAIFEYKNYGFDVADPEVRKNINRPTRMLPMQNPPIVHKEHGFTLLTRLPHVIDFNDEVGWQADVFYSLLPNLVLSFNGAVASRRQSWVHLPGGRFRPLYKTNELFPALDEEFSPFWEAYCEVEWYFDGQSYLRAAFNRRWDAPYEEASRQAHVIATSTLPLRVEYMLDETYSLQATLEQQWARDDGYPVGKQSFFNEYIVLTLSHMPDWAVSLRAEFTSDEYDPSGKKSWLTGEASYRLGNVHTATVSYGSERGGLVCSNGICRVVQPFTGVRFQLFTQL